MLEQHHLGASGVFNAELNEFLARTLGEDGYAGVEVRVTPIRTEIIIRATRTQVETVETVEHQQKSNILQTSFTSTRVIQSLPF